MRFGKFLKPGMTIGLIAPSFGCDSEPYYSRLQSAISFFRIKGYNIKESDSIYNRVNLASNTKEIRAKEFMDMYLDSSVDFMISVGGGEMLLEIIPLIDFNKIKEAPPKWFMGYSDNSSLTFLLTTLSDVGTIYGSNAPDFGMQPLDESLSKAFEVMEGKLLLQEMFDKYEINEIKTPSSPLLPYNKTEEVKWKSLNHFDCEMKGLLLGGCLDTMLFLGNNYNKILDFVLRNGSILWYFETCELNPIETKRYLHQLKELGLFINAQGFIFGRPMNPDDAMGLSFSEAITDILGYEKPIIIDADFGHLPPRFTILNGAIGTFTLKDGKGTFKIENPQ